MSRTFFDSNILVYAFTPGSRSEIAYALLNRGGVVSTQSLNELANVLRRKQKQDWLAVHNAIQAVIDRCPTIVALTMQVQQLGLRMAERYRLSIYDGMIVAAALTAECDILYSEDMHDGLVIDGRLTVVNPFAPAA
ncbi:PIN domain-containing protein [Sphingomonas sp. A2-49]|uniref:PIN domain-containing protein n=1 Tax=Sphingomonas sp. A2-49 TaxID=1391375 RepID=UPI0021CF6466|nr:PIN domain-containing protein [Sphingomonas sp. A2-49]MCU6455820.1 PIN domain-containing protein [Sphingomonas sp. A2-49]